ncbi:SEC10/PgrA surface exclusion domain-containing protein [Ligilactobacillus equi]|uniref:SEC10/PgrA surface exclusion domain-containing protein n=1 Tax=Ligilactobacillus equi TaxID=137357 RepID=UPI002ED28758
MVKKSEKILTTAGVVTLGLSANAAHQEQIHADEVNNQDNSLNLSQTDTLTAAKQAVVKTSQDEMSARMQVDSAQGNLVSAQENLATAQEKLAQSQAAASQIDQVDLKKTELTVNLLQNQVKQAADDAQQAQNNYDQQEKINQNLQAQVTTGQQDVDNAYSELNETKNEVAEKEKQLQQTDTLTYANQRVEKIQQAITQDKQSLVAHQKQISEVGQQIEATEDALQNKQQELLESQNNVTQMAGVMADQQAQKAKLQAQIATQQNQVEKLRRPLAEQTAQALQLSEAYVLALKNLEADSQDIQGLVQASAAFNEGRHPQAFAQKSYAQASDETADEVELSNLSSKQKEELNVYVVDLINQYRRQLGYKDYKVSQNSIQLADKVIEGYNQDNWNWLKQGADVDALLRVGYQFESLAPGSMSSKLSMAKLKKLIAEAVTIWLFYDYPNAPGIVGSHHFEQTQNILKGNYTSEYVGLGFDQVNGGIHLVGFGSYDGRVQKTPVLKSSFDKQRQVLKQAQTGLAQLQAELQQISEKIAQHEETKLALNQKVVSAKEAVKNGRLELAALKASLKDLKATTKQLRKQLTKSYTDLQESQATLQSLTTQFEELAHVLQDKKELVIFNQNKLVTAQDVLAEKREQLAIATAKLAARKSKLEITQFKLNQARQILKKPQAHYDELMSLLQAVAQAQLQSEAYQEQVAEAQQTYQVAQKAYQAVQENRRVATETLKEKKDSEQEKQHSLDGTVTLQYQAQKKAVEVEEMDAKPTENSEKIVEVAIPVQNENQNIEETLGLTVQSIEKPKGFWHGLKAFFKKLLAIFSFGRR